MKTLIVAATAFEIQPLLDSKIKNFSLDTLITGVGMTRTAYMLGQHLAIQSYDLIINAGIAGSFDRNLMIGEVVEVVEDRFSELGAEDGDSFLTIDDLGFGNSIYQALQPKGSAPHWLDLKKVCAITVNSVHGQDASIARLKARLPEVTVESMEGAAVFLAANERQIPALQIRAISNYVERRDRESWDIPLAIKNLNDVLLERLSP